MRLKLLKFLRFLHLVDKETYNQKRSLLLIENSDYFDVAFYKKHYQKVDFTKISPAEHYLTIGYKKGYNPSSYFSTIEYLTKNPDVIDKNPLLHYEVCGRKEGRDIGNVENCKYTMRFWQRFSLTFSAVVGKMIYHQQIKKNQHAQILVCLHLYYMDAWSIIKKYLENLSPYQYDLIVTYVDKNQDEETLTAIKRFKPNTRFYAYTNRGFDVGPFVDILQKIDLKAYNIVFKIHSKGIRKPFRFIYNQVFKYDDWFYNLINGILGGINCHRAISILMNNKKAGMVAAKNLIIIDPPHKQELTQNVIKELNITLPQPYHYVAGTMFAIKSECLEFVKTLNLNMQDFGEPQRRTFTFAHAIERVICALIEKNNYQIIGLQTLHKLYFIERRKRRKYSPIRLLKDDRFEIDADFFYKALENRIIKNYDVHKIRIGDVNRKWIDGNLYKLKECSPFLYLSGDKKRYQNYCQINKEISSFEMSEDKFNELINSLDKGYNAKQMPVIYGSNNILMDGQHRLCYLLKKYGEDYEVDCLHLNNITQQKMRSKNV